MVDLNANKKKLGGAGFNPSFLLPVFLIVSLALLIVWTREGPAGPIHVTRNVVATVSAPFQALGSIISYPVRAIGNAFHNITADTENLRTLERENEELTAEVTRLQEYAEENQRLTLLLDIKDAYSLDATGARVIGQSTDTWNRTITIDKGSRDGVEIGMPVMSANGLVGQVESVSLVSSTVRLITDERSGVACVLQTSRAEGILTGSVEGLLYIKYVPTSYSVEVGDAVVTSGLGGSFPKGIVIGEVTDVQKSDSELYYTILVEPITRVTTYEEVLVVTGDAKDVGLSNKANVKVSSEEDEGEEGGSDDE